MHVLLGTARSANAISSIPACLEAPSKTVQQRRRDRYFAWLLIGVWIVNCCDLELTLLAAQQRMLWELNPVVGKLLPFGPKALTCYKFALLGIGSLILWRYRAYRLAAVALWIVAIACVVLSFVWYQLYFGSDLTWGGINTAYFGAP